MPSVEPKPKGGCGCAVPGEGGTSGAFALVGLAVATALARRKRVKKAHALAPFVALSLVAVGVSCNTRATKQPPATSTGVPSASVSVAASAFPALHNDSPFAPAFTRLEAKAEKVDVGMLGDPVQCVTCHADVVAQWEPSSHHNSSFSNRFYASAVDLTRKHRGNKTSRWCGGCHDPSLACSTAPRRPPSIRSSTRTRRRRAPAPATASGAWCATR